MGPSGPFFILRITMAKADKITELLAPLIEEMGYEYVGMEYLRQPGSDTLRIYIDEPDRGVQLEDCEKVSHEVSAILDVEDPISGQYMLEISSPGLDRPLFTTDHYNRFAGEMADIRLIAPVDGRRKFKCKIVQADEQNITVEQDGETVELPLQNVVKARLIPAL